MKGLGVFKINWNLQSTFAGLRKCQTSMQICFESPQGLNFLSISNNLVSIFSSGPKDYKNVKTRVNISRGIFMGGGQT